MRKLLVRALPAFALCAALAVIAVDRGWLRLPAAAKPIGDVPVMSDAEARAHRDSRYAQIASIEELLGLPGHFARMEALYALAGRSDSAAVQNLIYQANGIADLSSRRDTLLVLFTRLAELDPKSALALSRTPAFAADPVYEREVWQRWGERDLDAALQHAAAQAPESRRDFAAQALMAAYGYWGNEQTARIAELLDAEPDDRTRAARLDELARSDPAAAIAYVHSIESPLHRRQAALHLGVLLGREGLRSADRYAGLLGDRVLEHAFQEGAAQSAAAADPAGTLGILLANGSDVPASRLVAAFTGLAGEDLEQALAWYERVQDPQKRLLVGSALAERFARADPPRALAWARRINDDLSTDVYRQVLTVVAETDPKLAMDSAAALTEPRHRLVGMMTVARSASEIDPERALALLDEITSPRDRNRLAQYIAANWVQQDPEAALHWIFAADVAERSDLVGQAAAILANRDVDAAIRLLPRVDEQYAPLWRQQIVSHLAADRSVAEARRFIADYEGSPEYPQLEAAIVEGVATKDAAAAAGMLEGLPADGMRQMLYSTVFMHYALQDPRAAAEAAASIADDSQRSNLIQQVVNMWAQNDDSAAERWVDSLPPSKQRDAAISGVASQWHEVTLSRRRMLESIADPMLRKQAAAGALFRVGRENLQAAERLLHDLNLPAEDKEELREQMEIVRKHSGSPYIGVW